MTIMNELQMDNVSRKKNLFITQKEKIRVIAECGCNWESFADALVMVEQAKLAGCWGAKFQLFTKEMAKESKISQDLVLDLEQANELFQFGKFLGINVFFTPMYEKAVDWCEHIDVNYYKIRHKDNNNVVLYRKVKKTRKFTFISINRENDLWSNYVNYKKGVFLYCVPRYPANINDYNEAFEGGYLGISDHTGSLDLLKKAIDHNIQYIEIHVKLDDTEPLEDKWSVSFSELKEVIKK